MQEAILNRIDQSINPEFEKKTQQAIADTVDDQLSLYVKTTLSDNLPKLAQDMIKKDLEELRKQVF